MVTTSCGGCPGIHQASGYSSSSTSIGPRAAGSPAGSSGARSRRCARAWPRLRRASTSSRASIAVVQAAPHASSRVSTAAHTGAAERSYAAVTAGGAGANTWSRTVWKTAAAPSTRAARQHSRTVATRHCHTHSATTGSRSVQAARVSARGMGTAAVRATTLSRSRQTVMPGLRFLVGEGCGSRWYGERGARRRAACGACPRQYDEEGRQESGPRTACRTSSSAGPGVRARTAKSRVPRHAGHGLRRWLSPTRRAR